MTPQILIGENLDSPLNDVSYEVGIEGKESCNITFTIKNLPTYTNYSIKWSYNNGLNHEGDTWRIFTPYLWNCSKSGNSLVCGSEWNKSFIGYTNIFYLNNFKVGTRGITAGKFGIGDISNTGTSNYYSYCWNGSEIKVWKCFLENSDPPKGSFACIIICN